MINKFESYIKENQLCHKKDNILIGTSGGVDSVVLTHLFLNCGYNISIAHCNFSLRGKESDDDEVFVKKLCQKYGVKSHFIKFNTIEFAKQNKLSIEMAARNLRYDWFNSLLQEFNYSLIATGHHLNDSIETFLLNLTRGTGLKGLIGIPVKNEHVIRPILFASREQIEKYAQQEKLSYRNDSSNNSQKYMRNIIRQQVIPALKKINPRLENTFINNISTLQDTYSIFKNQIDCIKTKSLIQEKNKIKILISEIDNRSNSKTILYELINEFGFNSSHVEKIISATADSGRLFYSQTHQLLIDRQYLIIEPLQKTSPYYIINTYNELNKLKLGFNAEILSVNNFSIDKNPQIACLDLELIKFPVKIRKWKEGDSFYPLGMNKKKKLSDFFIDEKIDLFKKKHLWIFECDAKIFWISGHRIDDRFKITDNTNQILKIEIR
ncbi:MAG: tRNA lysidine(34) synthetase TilS [Salinivirgaceae bacterium]|nr:tRNA lysidine(34) synthetase TilS [Salinivirgaceae bacterium]